MAPETCPNCGVELPPKARCCPACGSDEKTGWSEEAATSGLDLPDDSFDYDDFVKREFGGPAVRPRGISWVWWLCAVGLLVAFFVMFVLRK
jgi:hypothetical protein